MKIAIYILGILMIGLIVCLIIGAVRSIRAAEMTAWALKYPAKQTGADVRSPKVLWREFVVSYKISLRYADGVSLIYRYSVDDFGLGELHGDFQMVTSK